MENGASYEEAFAGNEIGDMLRQTLSEKMESGSIVFGVTSHYNQYEGFEVIDVCEQLRAPDGSGGFNRGNAFKYLARAGWKSPEKHLEDLEKAKNYIQREIDRVGAEAAVEKNRAMNDIYRCAVCYLQVIPPSYLCSEHPDRATIMPDGDTAWLHTRGTRKE